MSRKYKNRQGLTLLELVVVMVILVALAGILVPMLPGMLGRAHAVNHSANVVEINKVWGLYANMNGGYPDGLDSLISGTGLFSQLPGGSDLIAAQLDDDQADALKAAGITTVYSMDNTTDNATMEPYGATPTTVTIDEDEYAAFLNGAAARRLFGDSATAALDAAASEYVVFGVGQNCTAIGTNFGMQSAPLHFDDHGHSPVEHYSRFGVVFNTAVLPASFVGTVAFHEGHLSGLDDAIAGWHGAHQH
ncbi:MAG: prepilin-type N-terminal cleavage/methylation domain-containing protein [Pirellulaceae bacterium]|nr:prepilin-type N-terminal cleavage/methylation domain-containing protein [Pirellulaceae bacterium]